MHIPDKSSLIYDTLLDNRDILFSIQNKLKQIDRRIDSIELELEAMNGNLTDDQIDDRLKTINVDLYRQ